jgi:hemolysin activation/secretion protein
MSFLRSTFFYTITARFSRELWLAVLAATLAPCLGAQETSEVRLFVREIRVQGATVLSSEDVQRTVYPYLGPGRTLDDVERARAALEALYQEKGYQAARVEVPPQQARRGVVLMKVTEGRIGRLRVTGSRYNDIEKIRAAAPSLQEGKVPNYNDISRDAVALNQRADRRIMIEPKPGAEPGLLDVDLKVEDEAPITASAELNNRYSADTTKLRLNTAASYDNLWQEGHSIGGSLQTTPLDWFDEVMVYSGFYLARFDALPEWTFQASATKQDSNISTLGGTAVAGRGEIYGLRATRVLPSSPGAFHSLSFGIDRKHFTQQVNAAGAATNTPVTYFPISLLYSGAIQSERSETDFFIGTTLHVRGLGSDSAEFDLNRFRADPSFITLRTDFSHMFKLSGGFTLTGRTQGQLASGPLLSNEQFAGGGLDTMRGYLEGESLGDHGVFGSVELGSPSLIPGGAEKNTLKVHAFIDGGALILTEPLPDQDSRFALVSYGIGMRLRFFNHLEGSVNVAVPVYDEGKTEAGEPFVSFVIKGQL